MENKNFISIVAELDKPIHKSNGAIIKRIGSFIEFNSNESYTMQTKYFKELVTGFIEECNKVYLDTGRQILWKTVKIKADLGKTNT